MLAGLDTRQAEPGQLGWSEETWDCPDGARITYRYKKRDVLDAQLALERLQKVTPVSRHRLLYSRVLQEYGKIAVGLVPTEVTIAATAHDKVM